MSTGTARAAVGENRALGRRIPELLAPAGSFQAGYHAFEAGADAVYLGLKRFSARQGADNFTIEQLRRLKGLAAGKDRRIYAAVNTVVKEREIADLAESLHTLVLAGIDGIIIQDLGVYAVAREFFPSLEIHASTQMAAHDTEGLAVLEELGLSRVILPRELPIEAIRRLRADHPDIGLEVFIHGALCYGYSGMCLASFALTGRSGNRGECAQICRGTFRSDSGEDGHLFSCGDLVLDGRIGELVDAGVDALKIEGRMKSPEYVASTVRLYRRLLDQGGRLDPGEHARLGRESALAFQRRATIGYLHSASGTGLIESGNPGHRGVTAGFVERVADGRLWFRTNEPLSLHDDLQFAPEWSRGDPAAFAVRGLRVGGKPAFDAHPGDEVSVALPAGPPVPRPGREIFLVSSRILDLDTPGEKGFPLWRTPVDICITVSGSGIGDIVIETEVRSGPLGGWTFRTSLPGEPARTPRPLLPVLAAAFADPGASLFHARVVETRWDAAWPDGSAFVPSVAVKRLKTEWYRDLGEEAERRGGEIAAGTAGPASGIRVPVPSSEEPGLPSRESFMYGTLPWVTDVNGLDESSLPRWDGRAVLILPPVGLSEGWSDLLVSRFSARGGARFLIGLNNVGHLLLAERCAALGNVSFFIDYHLYVANRPALRFYAGRVPRLEFVYSWIEGGDETFGDLKGAAADPALPRIARIGPSFVNPVFLSAGCFAKHVLGRSCGGCPKSFSRIVTQGNRRFQVEVRDCMTYVTPIPSGSAP